MIYTMATPPASSFAKAVIKMGLGNGQSNRPPEGKMWPRGKA